MKNFCIPFFFIFFLLVRTFAQSERPNIILFLADDFGYGSSNVYGAPDSLIRTPNINRLAQNGIQFTNAYTTGSVCSPTRYAIMTGEYSWRSRLKKGVVQPFERALIDVTKKTLPEYLQSIGYRTAAVGKWHLGYKSEDFKNLLGSVRPGPNDHGFDYSFTVPNNLDDVHKIYVENDGIYGLRSDRISPYGKSFYGKQYTGYDAPQRLSENVMDDLTHKSIEWIRNIKDDKPFFLYFASVAVHHPIMPSHTMRGMSNAGAYGDFIQDIDRSLAMLISCLEAKGIRENTLIIFASDNGAEIPNNNPTAPENFAIAKGLRLNGDLRGDKHTIWEGGFKIPFIVNHPARISKGGTSDALVSTVDIYDFIADYLEDRKSLDAQDAPDSYSFASVVGNTEAHHNRPPLILRDANGRKSVRYANWKYIEPDGDDSKNKSGLSLLFDLSEDPMETKNIVETNRKKTSELQGYLEQLLNETSKTLFNEN